MAAIWKRMSSDINERSDDAPSVQRESLLGHFYGLEIDFRLRGNFLEKKKKA